MKGEFAFLQRGRRISNSNQFFLLANRFWDLIDGRTET